MLQKLRAAGLPGKPGEVGSADPQEPPAGHAKEPGLHHKSNGNHSLVHLEPRDTYRGEPEIRKKNVASPMDEADERNQASDGCEHPGKLKRGSGRGKNRLGEAATMCSDHVLGVLQVTLHL